LTVGGSVSLSRLADTVKNSFPELSGTILRMCSEQIRTSATLSGNIINASPVADTVPLLMAVGAEINLESVEGTRTVSIRNFFHGYKKTENKPNEWIKSISIPINKFNFINFEKVTKRIEVDISAVNSAIALNIKDGIIQDACVAYGGVGPTTLLMPKTSSYLKGKPFTEETFIKTADITANEAIPISDVRGSAEYRKAMLKNIMIMHYISSDKCRNEVAL
jgi:xanthine dehydrogenase small subunit